MTLGPSNRFLCICSLFFLGFFAARPARAQSPAAALHGQVTDPSGAAITGATVLLTTPDGNSISAMTDNRGFYDFKNLAAGKYIVKCVAGGFNLFTQEDVELAANQTRRLNIPMSIAVQQQKVEVNDSSTHLSLDSSNNAGAIVLKGEDLEALSDDPDDLQSDLQALAGPSAGPNGGQIYIDGFTGGQLPPKSSIREIRINQNPFSAEFDSLGYGRIEIFTKPGTDKLHGQFSVRGNTNALNSRNPFVSIPNQPGYHTTQYEGSLSGALTRKASFFLDVERRNIDELSVVSATVLDPSLNPVPFSDAVSNPRTRAEISPRLDYQLTPNNTLTLRYQYYGQSEDNNGVGQFDLPSQGFDSRDTEHTLQASDTQIIGTKTVNETRFRYRRERSSTDVLDLSPAVSVSGSFNSGGNTAGTGHNVQDSYEFQNYTSMALGAHFLKYGARLRASRISDLSTSDYNGSFTFGARTQPGCISTPSAPCPVISSLEAFQITQQGLAAGDTPDEIRAAGGGASQFSITQGTPLAENTQFDLGLYVQDDWRVRSNVTLSYGLRYETQNNIGDHADFAPRLGVAWGLGSSGKNGSPKTVVRAGFGVFYDRFDQDQVVNVDHLNGVAQQRFIVTNPDSFPALPDLTGALVAPTIYRISPDLRAPYTMQAGVTLERQLSRFANLAVTYLGSRGNHMLYSRNINAPLPGTFDPSDPASGVRPLGTDENVYQYESGGIYKENQLIVNGSVRMGQRLTLFGYYSLSYANSDADGASGFLSNSYDRALDYGPAGFNSRNRVFIGGSIGLPLEFRVSPFMVFRSGRPFDITTGQDLNGDSIFNDRPSFATLQTDPAKIRVTKYGTFDLAPLPGETIIPVNSEVGPSQFTLNLRLEKTFGFGKKEGAPSGAMGPGGGTFGRGMRGGHRGGFGGGYRYNLSLGVSARNLLNNVNLSSPIGNLSSPLFGESNGIAGGFGSSAGSAANRRIDLELRFSF